MVRPSCAAPLGIAQNRQTVEGTGRARPAFQMARRGSRRRPFAGSQAVTGVSPRHGRPCPATYPRFIFFRIP
ncbi:hypothetical protein RGUI_0878 [Rhodovulum sp. P5]|nr:hypothetical protein RGUI_0878 [Rhodovulum sp. P5]